MSAKVMSPVERQKGFNTCHINIQLDRFAFKLTICVLSVKDLFWNVIALIMQGMNEWWFRPRFCNVKAILGRRQPGRMR